MASRARNQRREDGVDEKERYEQGMAKRRATLGAPYVERTTQNRTPLNTEFQEFITRYAWGEIWTRPGLDDHTRRIVVLASTVTGGRWEEYRLHLRAALEGGLTQETLKEVLMQLAIYAGVPAANTAFHIAAEVIAGLERK
jgi:4-carboxymuconolactone decarboxylase